MAAEQEEEPAEATAKEAPERTGTETGLGGSTGHTKEAPISLTAFTSRFCSLGNTHWINLLQ